MNSIKYPTSVIIVLIVTYNDQYGIDFLVALNYIYDAKFKPSD